MPHFAADCLNDACRVVTQYAVLSCRRRMRRPNFHIGRIDRNRLHGNQNIVRPQFGFGQFDVEQGFRVGNGQRAVETDGFHDVLLLGRLKACIMHPKYTINKNALIFHIVT